MLNRVWVKFFVSLRARILWVVLGIISWEQVYTADNQKVLVLSIPKAGTQLVKKAMKLITKKRFFLSGSQGTVREVLLSELQWGVDNYLFCDHLVSEYNFLKADLSDNPIKVVQIRDPRDILLSQISWMEKMESWWMSLKQVRAFNELPFDERLSRAILMPDANYGVRCFARNALDWMKNPTVFVCRFEDLVGPKGGGSRKRQEKTIEALAIHLGYPLEPERVAEIADELFGGTRTFRHGQIGGWKEYFTPEHIELFKQVMGKELIELGYEIDNEW